MNDINEYLRRLPSVEILTTHPRLESAIAVYSRPLVVDATREVIDGVRRAVTAGGSPLSDYVMVDKIMELLPQRHGEYLRGVINATGVLIHTNLGRVPLGKAGVAPEGYSNLEYELAAGKRGKRGRLVDSMIARLAGAEAALVVNNNAAAVYLCLSGLAAGKEVIISRGELVQIGGGFRIPDILARSGARLVEVGTTNKTSLSDYAGAVGPATGLILKVHRSNFKMTGFIAEAGVKELSGIGREQGIPLVMDLGSGAVSDLRQFGLPHEPTLSDCIRDGADLVTASGDKLFGGPQAGMIAGTRELIEKLRSDPFYRALRPDKTCLAGLACAARAHLDGSAAERLPLYRMLAFGLDKLRQRAEDIMLLLRQAGIDCKVIMTESTVGGGSLPEELFQSVGLEIRPEQKVDEYAAWLRGHQPPIIGTITEGIFRLDLRTVLPEQDPVLMAALVGAAGKFAL
jgi:L-seryl-tRNA(Ser) seleniumtransferase